MLPFIHLFGTDISMYTVLAVAGALAISGFCVLQCRFPRKTPPLIQTYDIFYMLLYGFIGAVVGAKLLYLLT